MQSTGSQRITLLEWDEGIPKSDKVSADECKYGDGVEIERKDKQEEKTREKKGRKQFFSEMYSHRISLKYYIQQWAPHT